MTTLPLAARAGSLLFVSALDEGGDATPGMLARADSGSSTTSDGRASSMFESGSSDRRSSFASSVRSDCVLEEDVDGEQELESSEMSKSSSNSSANSGDVEAASSSSLHAHPYDLATPTVEHGTSAVRSKSAAKHSGGSPSLSDRLKEVQLQQSNTSRRVEQRPSTSGSSRSTASAGKVDGFPWNATASTSMRPSSSHSTSTAVGTPSAIFGGDGSDDDDDDESEIEAEQLWRYPFSEKASNDDVNRVPSGSSAVAKMQQSTSAVATATAPSSSTRASFSSASSSSSSGSKRLPPRSSTDMLAAARHIQQPLASGSSNSYMAASPSALSSSPSSPATTYQPVMPSASSISSVRGRPATTAPSSSGNSRHKSSSSAQFRSSPVHASSSSRPSTSSGAQTTGSSRPWVKDSDAASLKSTTSAVSSDGSFTEESGDTLSVMSPAAPPPVPFLSTAPQPAGCRISVDASDPHHFTIIASLPGFALENITLALKRNGSLHILADRYDDSAAPPSSCSISIASNTSSGGHFEKMVELGDSAIGSKVSAEFDGKRLKVTVLKRDALHSRKTSATSSSMRGSFSAQSRPITSSGMSSSRPTTASGRPGTFGGIPSPPLVRNKSSPGLSTPNSASMTSLDAGEVNPFAHAMAGVAGSGGGRKGQSSL